MNLFKKLLTPKVKITAFFLLAIISTSILIAVLLQINKSKEIAEDVTQNLPSKEKVAEGVWELKNYDPIKQTLAKGLKAEDMKIVPNNNGSYKWISTNASGTRFMFGKSVGNGILPKVRIVNKDGWFVEYIPKEVISQNSKIKNESQKYVTPKVNGNLIEWEIYPGVIARYTMQSDRVKADYIVDSASSLQQLENKLEFDVISGNEKDKEQALGGALMPEGDIEWYTGNEEIMNTQFTFPKPLVFDNNKDLIGSEYELEKVKESFYLLAINLDQNSIKKAAYPITVDPVTIDSAASATGTAYANGRKILRDAWGNLIAFMDGGTGNDNVYYKNYNSSSWTDANIDVDNGAGTAHEIAADLDSTGSAHLVFRNSTDSDIEYLSLSVVRDGNNTISSIGTQSRFDLDTSNVAARPSLIIANKGGGAGVEKIAIAYAVSNSSDLAEIRFMQCDISDNCLSAANWKNASEEKNASATCDNSNNVANNGLPTSSACKGVADSLFYSPVNSSIHAVLTQFPETPIRSPASVKKDLNGTFSDLTNTNDENAGTTDDLNSLTTTDYIYIGDDKPFSKISYDVVNTNSNVSFFSSLEYWNGSGWTSSSNFDDNTANSSVPFSEDGSMIFDQPSDWVKREVDGNSKYWIRLNPWSTFDATVSISEIYINDRNSKALLVIGGINSNDDLRATYVIWDEISNSGWENSSTFTAAPWVSDAGGASSAISDTGGNWGTFTNFPLSATVDYKNNNAFIAYVRDSVTDFSQVASISNTKDVTDAANWDITTNDFDGLGVVAADVSISLTADGSDIYLFSVDNAGSSALVFYKCTSSNNDALGITGVCDNIDDWGNGTSTTFYNDTTVAHPNAVVSKVTGDTIAIDTLITDTTDLDVLYERQYIDLADNSVAVAASSDDGTHSDCDTGTDDKYITIVFLGRDPASANCVSGDSENHVGFRFLNITVAQGTKISSAYIDFGIFARTGSTNLDFTIYGEDVDDAPVFTAADNCTDPCSDSIENLTRTTNSVSQSINFATNRYRFDVTDIVQEIVCRGAANSQPCAGDFNSSGSWTSGNDIAILFISSEGGASDNYIQVNSFDEAAGNPTPKLQINVAPSTTTDRKYSMGSGTQLPTGSGSVSDLDHPFSSVEYGAVASDDTSFASVSATTNFASTSAQPAFMFKVNNTNNNNTYKIVTSAILKSSLATSNKSIYLQVYRGGSTDDWVTVDTDSATAADTELTLTGTIDTNLSEYYFNETPGIGTQYAECTTGTANCWTYWRIYQDAPGNYLNANLNLDYFNAAFSENVPDIKPQFRGGTRIRGGTRLE